MKRTYLAKRNALLSRENLSWGALALVVAGVFLLLRLIAPNALWYVFTPAFQLSDAFARSGHIFFSSFGNTSALTLQNENLVRENTTLALQNKALSEKIDSISGLVADPQSIIVGVVARPPESPYDTLVLSGGSDDGITAGMEAFGEGNVPIGVVSAVLAHFSRVTLFSTPGIVLNGWVTRAHYPLSIQGAGAGTLSASAPRAANIVVGDTVFAPGPGGLPIGTVARIDSDPSSPSVTLHITPARNLFSITWVVLRDTGNALKGAFASTTPLLP